MIDPEDVEFLLTLAGEHSEHDKEMLLNEFHERFKYATTMEINFSGNASELHKRVQAKTIILSELWYCFELFKPMMTYGFGTVKRKSSEQSNKEWLDTQRISIHGSIEAEKVRKQNLFLNVDFSYDPCGNASLFDESYFSGKWFYFTYGNVLSDFSLISNNLPYISHDTQISSLTRYLDALQLHSQGEQKLFLARGFNALIGASAKDITSADILSFIYALRCNYVHNGEVPNSYQMPPVYKEFIMDECIKFLTCYCSMVYLAIIDELYLR